jgi:hypothetical protein
LGGRHFSKQDISPNGPSDRFQQLRPPAIEKAQKHLRLYFAEKLGKATIRRRKKHRRTQPVCLEALTSREVEAKEKQWNSRPDVEFRAIFASES